jgi:hypothetical protein
MTAATPISPSRETERSVPEMTLPADPPAPDGLLANSVGSGRPTCACGCGRTPQRSSGFSWLCDPNIAPEVKALARGRGQKRKALDVGPVELRSIEGRQALRAVLAQLVLEDKIAPSLATCALRALDGAAQDEERNRPRVEDVSPIEVHVARFTPEPPA